MPKITVWKCPNTSKLFEDEKVYRTHLKRSSRERIAAREWQAVRDSITDVITGAQQVNNAQELVDYIVKYQHVFMIQGVFNSHYDDELMHKALGKGWDIYFPKLKSLKFDTNWRTEVSNSHNCPRDGYTNWSGNNEDGRDLRNYPGWHGKVASAYDKNDRFIKVKKKGSKTWQTIEAPSISDMMSAFGDGKSLSGVCTGSGGGGSAACQYEVSLFQSDFPNMEKKVTFAIIKGAGEKTNWGTGLRYTELDEMGEGEFKIEELENV